MMKFTFLGWRLAVGVQVGQSLIASIGYNANRSRYSGTALFEQLKVMVTAVTEVRGQDLLGIQVGHQLRFLGVPLLFAAVMPFLPFFGRSIGCSVASTSTILKIVSLGCNAFLPGK
jgi:hypothetical protein